MINFKIGDTVIYGSNGICHIEALRKLDNSTDRLYYVLKPMSSRAPTLFVPADNETLTTKMRYALTKDEIDAIILSAKGQEIPWLDDKNERHAYFLEIMRGGIGQELLLMINRIYTRKQEVSKAGKRLSDADSNALTLSETLVNEEFAYSLGIKPEEVGEYIRKALEED